MSEGPWTGLPRPWVADIGSGGAPHPLANILVDKYPGEGYPHRNVKLVVGPGQVFVEADAHDLPFDDGEIDFVWCCDLLEHVDDPGKVVGEMMRVSKKGSLLMPSVSMEGVIQMRYGGDRSNGHKWLCRSEGFAGLGFMRCDNSNKPEVRGLLAEFGLCPEAPTREYNTNIFHAWGWGSWGDILTVTTYDPTPENIENWNRVYRLPDEAVAI